MQFVISTHQYTHTPLCNFDINIDIDIDIRHFETRASDNTSKAKASGHHQRFLLSSRDVMRLEIVLLAR
jgi:hypothetical protein